VRSETKEEDNREAEARLEADKIEKARREVVESPRTQLATQAILPDDDDIVTRAVEVTGLAAMVAAPFL